MDRGSDSEDSINKSSDSGGCGGDGGGGQSKTCADCGTTKTPLWRGGPAGPKSLCNACGIRSRKKRRGSVGLNKSSAADKKKSKGRSSLKGKETAASPGRNAAVVKRWTMDNLRRKLGEEEQAAVVLIALSFGSVYA